MIRSQEDLLQWEAQIDAILGRMTLDQKVGQLHQVSRPDLVDPALIRQGLFGTALFASGAFAGHERDAGTSLEVSARLQKMAREDSDLGIPLLFGRDVIHGHHTVFPIPLGQAASWNPPLVERAYQVAAGEAAGDGLHWAFAPVADVGRDPRWGRVAEGYGEDPTLAGWMVGAAVRGLQQAPSPLLACLKHFAAYGAAEGGRDYARSSIGPYELWDVYLPPFREGFKHGASSVMASFNEIDGIPATANRHLLRDILKEDWGFNGAIVSDWNAIEELIEHGVARDRRDAARLAIEAGIDIDMVSGCYLEHLADLVHSGVVKESRVDEAVCRVLRLKFAAGLFENSPPAPIVPSRDSALQVAHELARDSIVLLRNSNNVLPLKSSKTILLAGPFAESKTEILGCWVCDGKAEWVVTVADALRQATDANVIVHNLADSLADVARSADVVIALLGEDPIRSGESHSIAELNLPAGQLELLQSLEVCDVPVVTVLFTGRPLVVNSIMRSTDALLVAWHPGTAVGTALVELLLGQSSPSGRLPMSFPYKTGQVPIYYAQRATGRPQSKGESRYLDAPALPQFGFGYGLSYSNFEFANLEIQQCNANQWSVSADATNTGLVTAQLHTQLYIRDLVASRTRPIKELKQVRTLILEAGAVQRVEFVLDAAELGFWNPEGKYCVEPGEFQVWIGTDANCSLQGHLTLEPSKGIPSHDEL